MPTSDLRLFAAAVLCILISHASAGCWKGGRKAPLRAEHLFHNHKPAPALRSEDLLPELNWCDFNGTNYCTASWNQHIPYYCGSCWVHGTLSMIQDRLKIRKGARGIDVMLARQTLLNCAAFHPDMGDGCGGGDPIHVFRYMREFGLPDESCQLYNATDHTKYGKHAEKCPAEAVCMNCMPKDSDPDGYVCWPVKTPILYHVTSWGKVEGAVEAMMAEIQQRGPIVCSIGTPAWPFTYGYHEGVYMDETHDTDVDHDVEVLGWGTENGVDYWLIRNSWGTYFGRDGLFKLARGINALQIEAGDCWYAEPEFQMEKDVVSGKLVGSMFGVFEPEAVIPSSVPEYLDTNKASQARVVASSRRLMDK